MTPATATRERPIPFSDPMMLALTAGRKTQTRRLRGLAGLNESPDDWALDRWQEYPDGSLRAVLHHLPSGEPNAVGIRCPYGQPGDRLWVREAWSAQYDFPTEYRGSRMTWYHETPPAWRLPSNAMRTYYRADRSMYDVCDLGEPQGIDLVRHHSHGEAPRWVPSIHMPRWASRITLEITDVRAVRLQSISEADAIAEGGPPSHPSIDRISREFGHEDFSRSWFAQLWDSINGKREGCRWADNPWLWALTFRRIGA